MINSYKLAIYLADNEIKNNKSKKKSEPNMQNFYEKEINEWAIMKKYYVMKRQNEIIKSSLLVILYNCSITEILFYLFDKIFKN